MSVGVARRRHRFFSEKEKVRYPKLELRAKSGSMKEDTIEITGFHAHVYFDTASRDVAARVREGLV